MEKDELSHDTKDSIVLVERGSDVEGEFVFFYQRNNAANAGAKVLIVYNNIEGILEN